MRTEQNRVVAWRLKLLRQTAAIGFLTQSDDYAARTLMTSLFDVGGEIGSPASRKASM